jgi:hypothetical protein
MYEEVRHSDEGKKGNGIFLKAALCVYPTPETTPLIVKGFEAAYASLQFWFTSPEFHFGV